MKVRNVLLTSSSAEPIKLTPEQPTVVLGRANIAACKYAVYVSRKQCKVTAEADGAEVECICKTTPTIVYRSTAHGGQPLKLLEGEKCVIQPGDRIVLLEAEGVNTPAFELRIDGSDAAPAAAGPPSDQPQPPPITPGNPTVTDGMVPLATPPMPPQAETFDFVEPPTKQRRSGEHRPTPAGRQPLAPADSAGREPVVPVQPVNMEPAAMAEAVDEQPAAPAPSVTPAKPVMVVLVGAPGSGKSTWAASLQQQSPIAWQRVNQDTIDKGKRGSRQQCVSAARVALAAGTSVVIDRTNFDAAQRADFMKLAAELGVPAYCVVLDLDVALCVKRATERTDHEGGLEGKNAKIAVYRMHKSMTKAGLPTAAEGFASIMVCPTVRLVAAALSAWAGYAGDAEAVGRQFGSAASKGSLPSMWGAAGATKPHAAQAAGRTADATGSGSAPAASTGGVRPSAATLPLASLAPASGGSTAATALGAPASGPADSLSAAASSPASLTMQEAATMPIIPQPSRSVVACKEAAVLPAAAGSPAASGGTGLASPQPNAFMAMMSASKTARPGASTPASPSRPPARKWGGRVTALCDYAMEPERFRSEVPDMLVDESGQSISIPDKFPKAQHHRLIIARDPGLDSIDALRRDHIPLLLHMQQVGERYIKSIRDATSNATVAPFRMGFHAVPSMKQMHLHVISQDFNSDSLKHKKHWNSFTQPGFFLPVSDVIQQLSHQGRLDVQHAAAEALLKEPLRCHRCGDRYQTMPALKTHLNFCQAPYVV